MDYVRNTISTDKAPAAIGPYSQAVSYNGLLFVSGQIPVIPETGEIPSDVQQQTEQVLKNLGAILSANGNTYEDVLKTTVFIKNMDDFGKINEIYGNFFKENPPARACVEVSRLPKDVLVEIEAIVASKK